MVPRPLISWFTTPIRAGWRTRAESPSPVPGTATTSPGLQGCGWNFPSKCYRKMRMLDLFSGIDMEFIQPDLGISDVLSQF